MISSCFDVLFLLPMRRLLTIVILIVLLANCTGRLPYDQAMDRADSLLSCADDSLPAAKKVLDSVGIHYHDFSEGQRMRYQLLKASWMNLSYVPFTSDSTMKIVADWYAKHGTDNEKMRAFYLLGCVYRDLGNLQKSIRMLSEAEECADTLSSNCDFKLLSRVCSQKSSIFHQQSMPRWSMEEIDKGVEYALRAEDTLAAIDLFNYKFSDYVYLDNIDSAIYVNERSSRLYKKHNEHRKAVIALAANIGCYVDKKMYSDAYRAMVNYEKESGFFNNGDIEKGREIYYRVKGDYFLALKQQDSAEFYYRKELKYGKDLNNQQAATEGLKNLYKTINMSDSAAKYAVISSELNDSIINSRQDDVIGLNVNNVHKIQKLLRENHQAKQREYIFIPLIILLVLLFCAIAIYYKVKHTDLKEKDKRPCRIQVHIEDRIESDDDKVRFQLEKELRDVPIYYKFDKYCLRGGKPTSKDWRELLDFIETKIPNFKTVIFKKGPLKKSDYCVCVLVRLGFRPRDIQNLLEGKYSNMSTTRSRLLKKIFGIEGDGKTFDKLIRSIK